MASIGGSVLLILLLFQNQFYEKLLGEGNL